ncbi:MAG: helix-hairpin-helix domain-containing protein [bacterium]
MKLLSRVVLLLFFAWRGVFAAEKIDINTAPLSDLIKIVHIGEARGLELVSLRPFSSLEDLVRIKGISKLRVEDIKKQGLAWVEKALPAELFEQEQKEQLKEQPKEQPPNPSGFFWVLSTAIAVAIFSGFGILLLKRKVKI